MANPKKRAPATKYGGKIVVCQPGTMPTAKSMLTTECTETTSGVQSPASNSAAVSYRLQCRVEPRQPNESIPYIFFRIVGFARSRSVPKSGTMPIYQKTSESVKYVETANTSHTNGL